MAWETITYKCGHIGQEQRYGPSRDRQRYIEWAERNKLCPDCYRKERESAEQPPPAQAYIRIIPEYNPEEEIPRITNDIAKTKDIIAQQMEAIDRILTSKNASPEERKAFMRGQVHYGSGAGQSELVALQQAKRKLGVLEDQLEYARQAEPRPPGIEIYILDSYAIKDTLKARGYTFGTYSKPGDLINVYKGWGKVLSIDEAPKELQWLLEQGPDVVIINKEKADAILQAIAEERPDLVPGMAPTPKREVDPGVSKVVFTPSRRATVVKEPPESGVTKQL